MQRFKLLFIIIIILFVGFVAVSLVIKPADRKTKETDIEQAIEVEKSKLDTPDTSPEALNLCLFEDSIQYKTYQEDSKSQSGEVQNNIGYVNNKFGLYIYSTEQYIKIADNLVNSNGGDWGYVLIPYNVKDYDENKWTKIFQSLQRKHLIPIIQLWDVDLDKYKEQTDKSAKFLAKMPWPISKKYISVYNETNDERFWKGKLDPEGYAHVLEYTIESYKKQDPSFFIMNGAFNATAPNGNGYMDQVLYMRRMDSEVSGIFKKLDGWASHSYPQPGFVGTPSGTGRESIRAYEWELSILSEQYDVASLPVFITETGWPHAEGDKYSSAYYPVSKVADYLEKAFLEVWLPDDRVVAVTPFTVYYEPPYDHFAFVKKDGFPYEHYNRLKSLAKIEGSPPVLFQTDKELTTCD